jgi:hypothetical protein
MFDFSNPLTEIQESVYKSHILNSFLYGVQVGFALLYINWSPGVTLLSAPCRLLYLMEWKEKASGII